MRIAVALVLVASLLAACIAVPDDDREAGERPGMHPLGEVQRAQARADRNGQIPPNALMHGKAQLDAMILAHPELQTDGGPVPVTWTSIGPGNIGGRVRAVCIHPTNPARIWIATAGGGVWRTDNGGSSWQPLNNLLAMLGCGCMVLDPTDPNHLYVGTGEGFFDAATGSSNTAILRGAGIFESTDAGGTWTQLASTANPDFDFVNRLAFSPANASVMLAATASGIWRSTDGGQTWNQSTNVRTLDVDFHPTDGLQAVAGRADGVAQYSTDGGASWSNATGITGASRIEIAYARGTPTTVYVSATMANFLRVWRSLDGGHSFAPQTTSNTIATYAVYNNCLWVDPTNAGNLIVAGVYPYRSSNAGVSFSQFNTGGHADYHVVVEHPGFDGSTNKRVYAGGDGGVFTRADWQTGSWSALNNGLVITQGYGAAVGPNSTTVLMGAQDNDTNRFTGNPNAWNGLLIGGDGGFCAADPTDANYFYGEYQHFGIARSQNGGASFTGIRGATANDPSFNFMPYFTLDPNNSNRMLACGRALWRADNVKTGSPPAWVQIKAPRACLRMTVPTDHFADNPPCNLSTCAVAIGNSDVVWAAHNDGELYRSANATTAAPTWTQVDQNGLPGRWINSIAIDPANHAHVVVSTMGYVLDNVWETNDNGASWHSISGAGTGAIPALPVSWVIMHPRSSRWLFAGTDLGLFCSIDGGGSWSPVPGGPELTSIEHLQWKNPRELLVTTHGRGCWFASIPAASATPAGTGCANAAPPLLSAGAPVLGTTPVWSMTGAAANALVWFTGAFGPPVPIAIGGCTVQVDLANAVSLASGLTSASGTWSYGMPLPAEPALVSATLTMQALVLDVGGPMLGVGDLSNGLVLVLGY